MRRKQLKLSKKSEKEVKNIKSNKVNISRAVFIMLSVYSHNYMYVSYRKWFTKVYGFPITSIHLMQFPKFSINKLES